jgi:hypothetical protein
MICNANSSMAAVALIALLLSVFQVPLHASGVRLNTTAAPFHPLFLCMEFDQI